MLESASPAGASWRQVATSRIDPQGRYQFRLIPRTSAVLRAVEAPGAAATADIASAATVGPNGAAAPSSPLTPMKVAARFAVHAREHAVLGSGGIRVAGLLLPVANRTLPCGTRVALHYGGRTVTAVVDDRGPYVGGRNWDLNQATAAALGFGGAGSVWVSG